MNGPKIRRLDLTCVSCPERMKSELTLLTKYNNMLYCTCAMAHPSKRILYLSEDNERYARIADTIIFHNRNDS